MPRPVWARPPPATRLILRCRRVSTSQPDQAGSAVTVSQRIQGVAAVRRCSGLSPSQDGGNIDTLDFERFQLIGHCPHAGWRFSWRSPPEVHPIGRCVDFPGCVPRIDRPNAQPSSRSLRLHGRAWLHPMRTRLDHRRGAPVVAWTKRLPACKARSGMPATWSDDRRRRSQPAWHCPWVAAQDRSGLLGMAR
jgi:hypothetical protein